MVQSISLVIITYNEEQNIRTCIESAADIVSEVIVLDSGSTDNTQKIAASLGAVVHTHAFDGHIQQKNRAKDLATKDWVLSLDADECLSSDLIQSIKVALESPVAQGFKMNRLNHFEGRPIKTCGWYPDTKLRLWKNGSGQWMGQNPHDRFELSHSNPSHLKGDILHYTYANESVMKKQVLKFANIAAQSFQSKPRLYLIFKFTFSSLFKFIRTYFFQLGFTDGQAGFLICAQQTKEVFLKYYWALKIKNGTHIQP